MKDSAIRSARRVALFGLGCLLLNFPILAIFNIRVWIWGVPILYLYLFGIWLVLILLIVLGSKEAPSIKA